MYDAERILEDADVVNVMRRLGITVKDADKNSSSDGNKRQILCPYHNDNNFGAASTWIKGSFKGMHCFACSMSKSLTSMVIDLNGWQEDDAAYPKALAFIAEDMGGAEQYIIESDLKKSKRCGLKGNNGSKTVPMLSSEELKLAGLNTSNKDVLNGIIVGVSPYKPPEYMLNNDESVIMRCYPNPLYKEDTEPEYNSFLDYINDKRNTNAPEVCEAEPFIYEWVIIKRDKENISMLANTDPELYEEITKSHLDDALFFTENALAVFMNAKGLAAANTRAELKHNKRILDNAIKRMREGKETDTLDEVS